MFIVSHVWNLAYSELIPTRQKNNNNSRFLQVWDTFCLVLIVIPFLDSRSKFFDSSCQTKDYISQKGPCANISQGRCDSVVGCRRFWFRIGYRQGNRVGSLDWQTRLKVNGRLMWHFMTSDFRRSNLLLDNNRVRKPSGLGACGGKSHPTSGGNQIVGDFWRVHYWCTWLISHNLESKWFTGTCNWRRKPDSLAHFHRLDWLW